MPRLIIFVIFLSTIPIANYMIEHIGYVCTPDVCFVPVAPGILAPSGVIAIGVALVLRNVLQACSSRAWVMAAIAAGTVMSACLAPASLVLASGLAFFLGEMTDWSVYTPLAKRNMPVAVFFAGIGGSAVDSALFLLVAFGNLAFMPGQFIGKMWATAAATLVIGAMRCQKLRCLFGLHCKYVDEDYGLAWITACKHCGWRRDSGNPMP